MHPPVGAPSPVTTVEAALLAALAAPVVVVLASYLIDAGGFAFSPWLMLVMAMVAAAGTFAVWRRSTVPSPLADVLTVSIVFTGLGGWTLWLARPSLLPLSSGPDLTHHLLLIGHIERHWRLVHDLTLERFLGEMTQYTPGAHVLTALAGAWVGEDGLHALHAVQAAALALKAALLTAVAVRSLPARAPRVLAAVPVTLLLATPRYFLGGFMEYGFLAQTIAELFVIGMWWTLVAWDHTPDGRLSAAFGLASAATFLTWPVYVGAPVLTLIVLLALRTELSWMRRAQHLALALAPLVLVGGGYLVGRLGWLQLAGTGGTAPTPSLTNIGPELLAVGLPGLLLAATHRTGRATMVFAAAAALEAAAFLLLARRSHATQPYMALKMVYLLVWPLALCGAFTLFAIWTRVAPMFTSARQEMRFSPASALATLFVLVLAGASAIPLWRQPRLLHPRPPAISEPLNEAGQWARVNLPVACIEYLTSDEETAYWLHLAVLGNPRMSDRTGDNDTYRLEKTLIRWLSPGGLPYAIVDLNAVPAGVRNDLDVVRTFGTAAVARRGNAATCPAQP